MGFLTASSLREEVTQNPRVPNPSTWLGTEMWVKSREDQTGQVVRNSSKEVSSWDRRTLKAPSEGFRQGERGDGFPQDQQRSRRQNNRTLWGAKCWACKDPEECVNHLLVGIPEKKGSFKPGGGPARTEQTLWSRENLLKGICSITYLIIFPPVWEGERTLNCPSPAQKRRQLTHRSQNHCKTEGREKGGKGGHATQQGGASCHMKHTRGRGDHFSNFCF